MKISKFQLIETNWNKFLIINYRKSLKETRGPYSFLKAPNAGLIQGRVSFKGGSY